MKKLILASVAAASVALAFSATAQTPAKPAASKAASAPAPAASSAANSETLPGGIIVVHTLRGKGDMPKAENSVTVHYRGYFPEGAANAGQEFDSSFKRNAPATFPLTRVIKCWTEGVQRMQPGGKATLTCPSAVAYGERGAGASSPPNATLKFDVELISIAK